MIRNTSGQDKIIATPSWYSFAGLQRHKTRWTSGILGALMVLTMAYLAMTQLIGEHLPRVDKERVRMATVERGELIRDIRASGKIVAANAPTLYSPASGHVDFHIKPGSEVTKNQAIATIHSPELHNQLEQEKALLDSFNNGLERARLIARRTALKNKQERNLAEVNWRAALREKERADISYELKLISQLDHQIFVDELNRAQLEYEHTAESNQLAKDELSFDIKTQESEVQRQQFVVEDLTRKVEQLVIRAPVSGVLGNWLTEQKSRVEINQALLIVVDLGAYEAGLEISETYADELELSQGVTLTINGHKRHGALSSISPEVRDQQVIARVRFTDEQTSSLRQNQRVNARILLGKKDNVLMIKRGAFVDAGGRHTYRIQGDVAEKIQTQLGGSSVSHIEIISGAQEGDTLVVSTLAPFKRAKQVRLY